MSSVGYVANAVGSAPSLEVIAVLEAWGHTVTTSTQAAFGGSTFAAQDVIVAGPTDRDDATFVADLDTHMTTHGVPLVVLATDGLTSAGDQARTSGVPDSTAAALGLIAVERRGEEDDAADSLAVHDDGRHLLPVSGLVGPDDFPAGAMLAAGDSGMVLTEQPEVVDRVTGDVIERSVNVAGTRMATNARGFAILAGADAGESRVGVRTGETFDARCAFFGATASTGFGREGAGILAGLVEWVQGGVADDYPTGGSTGAVLAAIDLSPLGTFGSGTIAWTASTPGTTSLSVDVSDDDGASWSAQSNGGAVAVLSASEDVSDKRLRIRVTLSTGSAAETPSLSGLVVTLLGEAPALQDFDSLGTLQGTAMPAGKLFAGTVTWISGENEGLSMEIREWDPATRTVRLFLPMRLDIAAGDVIDVKPGCSKRLLEDCRDTYGNVANFRGFPYPPGTDQITQFPDSQ